MSGWCWNSSARSATRLTNDIASTKFSKLKVRCMEPPMSDQSGNSESFCSISSCASLFMPLSPILGETHLVRCTISPPLPMTNRVTRLAPSPTGTLHLGNARTFLVNWAMARQRGWTVLLRIEDLDISRGRPVAAEQVVQTLAWLGIDFDGAPLLQSRDLEPYRRAMRILTDLRLAYACALTRSQIQQAASAPHGGEGELRFPPELRPRRIDGAFASEQTNYRFLVSDEVIDVHDQFAGDSTHHPFSEIGDLVIWTKLGAPAYQLAVVVDDAR